MFSHSCLLWIIPYLQNKWATGVLEYSSFCFCLQETTLFSQTKGCGIYTLQSRILPPLHPYRTINCGFDKYPLSYGLFWMKGQNLRHTRVNTFLYQSYFFNSKYLCKNGRSDKRRRSLAEIEISKNSDSSFSSNKLLSQHETSRLRTVWTLPAN